ncbi:hypothetical protein OG874_11950 [Nocardia sp. NBC_00565]|uniref:hypothetical protein n=1 Tax=Nocardia sp. NBC_00565 TaxID=2975993 RepID=UPI002E800B0D|nr:hypothetical protein [Nocardia sp. NBC_00565]WUC05800.1 hypothetical protein OG874_11950 [Nocardia sp. NBC_00565]
MKPSVGQMLASTVDATTVIVVRWPDDDLEITCGGAAMVDAKGPEAGTTGTADPEQMDGSQLGKRYADDERGVELLCTKAGQGTLALNGVPLPLKGAKPLPASD